MKAEMESSPNFPFFLLAVPGYDLSFVLHVAQSDTGIQRTPTMQYIAHRLGNKRPLQEGRDSDQYSPYSSRLESTGTAHPGRPFHSAQRPAYRIPSPGCRKDGKEGKETCNEFTPTSQRVGFQNRRDTGAGSGPYRPIQDRPRPPRPSISYNPQ